MGARLVQPYRPGEEVLDSAPVIGGQWYRIAEYDASVSGAQSQVAAEFVLSDGNADRNDFIRLRASVAYGDPNASLLLQEYTCWDQPAFTLARIVNTDYGSALEIRGDHPATANMRLRVRHEDFWPGMRWTPVNFTPVSAVPDDDGWVLTQRGIAPTGEWAEPALTSGWGNYGNMHAPAGYRMHPGSLVEVQGVVKNGSVGQAAFALPAGYRPGYRHIFPALGSDNGIARCDVTQDGLVTPITGANGYLTFGGIRFTAMR